MLGESAAIPSSQWRFRKFAGEIQKLATGINTAPCAPGTWCHFDRRDGGFCRPGAETAAPPRAFGELSL